MPLRVAEINGWLKAVNKCRECPFMQRYEKKGMVCEHNSIKMTEKAFTSLSPEDVIPVWCPLPEPGRDYREEKIETITKLKPLIDPHRPESLDREFK